MTARFNFSRWPYPFEIWTIKPTFEVAIKCSLIGLITVIGIVTNLVVTVLIIKYKKLQCSTNFFVLNFTVASLISLMFFPWMFLCLDLFQNFVLGEVVCKAEPFLRVTLMLIIVFSLVCVSYDRLLTVLMLHRTRMTNRTIILTITSIWIISLAIASPVLLWRTYKVREWSNYVEIWCSEDKNQSGPYWTVLLVIAIWVPLFAMIVFYSAIFIKLSVQSARSSLPKSVTTHRTKVARMTFTLVLVFAICWVPFTAYIILWNQEYKTVPDWLFIFRFSTHTGIYLNMALNPIIYGLQCESFRKILASLLPKRIERGLQPWTTMEYTQQPETCGC